MTDTNVKIDFRAGSDGLPMLADTHLRVMVHKADDKERNAAIAKMRSINSEEPEFTGAKAGTMLAFAAVAVAVPFLFFGPAWLVMTPVVALFAAGFGKSLFDEHIVYELIYRWRKNKDHKLDTIREQEKQRLSEIVMSNPNLREYAEMQAMVAKKEAEQKEQAAKNKIAAEQAAADAKKQADFAAAKAALNQRLAELGGAEAAPEAPAAIAVAQPAAKAASTPAATRPEKIGAALTKIGADINRPTQA